MYNLQMFSPTFNYGFKIILWIVIYIIVNEWGIMNLTFHQNTPHENVSFHPPSKPYTSDFPILSILMLIAYLAKDYYPEYIKNIYIKHW